MLHEIPKGIKILFCSVFQFCKAIAFAVFFFVSPATKQVGGYIVAYLFTFQHGCEIKIDIGS